MENILFEKEHKPKGSFPYIEFQNENLDFITHYHEEIEIAYIEKGHITAFCGPLKLALSQGDICIFMPGEVHNFITTEKNNVYIIKINPSSYIENIKFDTLRLFSNKLSPDSDSYSIFCNIIKEIYREYSEKKTGYEFAIRSHKNQLLSAILRNLEYKLIDSSKHFNLLNKVNGFLEENFSRKITLEEMADFCHLSKFYFSHILKELTGVSFINYLSLFRIEKSISMMRYSDKNITYIALECGFGNVRSFNRIFKKQLGTTPLMYRKSIK